MRCWVQSDVLLGPVGRCFWGSPQGGTRGAGFSYLVLLRRGECPRAVGVQRLAGTSEAAQHLGLLLLR